MKGKIKLFLVVWVIGLIGEFIFLFLLITLRIKFRGYFRFLKLLFKMLLGKEKRGLILYFRHTSLCDPASLPFFFFPFYLFFPRFIPYSTSGRKYHSKGWFSLFRPVSILIDRENAREALKTLREEIKPRLDKGGIVPLAPGGGRAFKGEEWKIIQDGKIEITRSWDENAKIIRRFQSGIGLLALETDANFLPVWSEGGEKIIPNQATSFKFRFWHSLKIQIGESFQPLKPDKILPQKEISKTRKAMVEIFEDTLLKLGER